MRFNGSPKRISRTGSRLQGCQEDVRGSHATRVNNDHPHYSHQMVQRLMFLNTGSFRIAVEWIPPTSETMSRHNDTKTSLQIAQLVILTARLQSPSVYFSR
ncbi:hypothetical protein NXS19_002805 [Fusarium pseudograminearum]|nr:hypothetical protein NXS19_002805 [Fusarium pseudograminearum]